MSIHLRRLRLGTALLVLALVSGCMRIPLSSLWALKQFSFETFEPATLRVAMRLPSGVALKSDSLIVDSKIKHEGEPLVEEHFALRESKDRADFAGLPEVDSTEGHWVVLKFDANEAQRVRVMRQGMAARKAAAEKASAPKPKSSIELGVSPKFCRTGPSANGAGKVSGALYWVAEKGYVTVMRETRLDDLLKDLDDSKDLATMPAC